MANIYKGTLGLIGNTPLVEVTNVEKELGLEATILVKLEYFNPAGSVKDRIAKAMIEDAEAKGHSERRFRDHRAYFRKYRYRTCIYRSSQRIPNHSYHAGDHERRAQKYPEGIWCRAGSDRRSQGNERSYCQSRRTGKRDSRTASSRDSL